MKSSIAHMIDGEYIREWLILGPFFPDDLDKDFLADVGGEANIDPKKGDTATTTDGRTLTWKRYESRENVVDLQLSMQMKLDDLRHEVSRKYHFSSFIGESAAIRQVHTLMEQAIDSGLTVLITGETGTGKELVARAIHHNSLNRVGV